MPNYKLTIEYNGAGFCGSQIQNNLRTVQAEIEKALSIYFREATDSCFSSRTDAGVHAIGQVLNFKTNQQLDKLETNPGKFLISLNGILPDDISATAIQEIHEEFNARFDAKSREYLYKIFNRRTRPVLRLDSLHWEKEPLDYERMAAKAHEFIGTHDFLAYTKLEPGEAAKANYLCTVYESELIRESKLCYKYKIRANRFLRHMVRKIVAELIAVGKGEEPNKTMMAPAQGLTLVSVEY